MAKRIQQVYRGFMLEMIEEVRTASYTSWSRTLLTLRIKDCLHALGGIAGEW